MRSGNDLLTCNALAKRNLVSTPWAFFFRLSAATNCVLLEPLSDKGIKPSCRCRLDWEWTATKGMLETIYFSGLKSSLPLPSIIGNKHHTDSGSIRYCNKLALKAVERLADDWERLVTFYQFPREHWPHLRTTNVVESPFATVRLRTTAAKRFKKVENATALIWKSLQVAESTFRKLKGAELLPAVYAGTQYKDGVQRSTHTEQKIAA